MSACGHLPRAWKSSRAAMIRIPPKPLPSLRQSTIAWSLGNSAGNMGFALGD